MSSVNIDRYITTTQTVARVQRLNQAILNKDILPVIGSSGSGKRAFLEWWWRGGCADPKFAGDYAITSDEILLITMLYPGPASASSIMLSGLEVALLELQRIQENGEKPRPLLQPKTLRTPAQLASLMRQVIQPLMDRLDPQALVVLNAHQLDTSALHYLIELYAPTRRSSVRRPERGLILCGNTQTPDKVNTPFKNVLQTAGFTRTALPEAMVYQPLADKDEFAQIITRLIRQTLQAVPAEDVPWQEIAARFSEWTDRDWFLIRTMARVADSCLGPKREGELRQFSRAVMECIERTWLKREPASG